MKRAAIIGIPLLIVLIGGAAILSPRLSDGTRPVAPAATTTPPIAIRIASLTDTYRRGEHTISGAVIVPTPCYSVDAQATTIPSTTPTRIRLDLTIPKDTGRCLQLAATSTFKVTQRAPKDAYIAAYINNTIATTTSH